MPVSYWASRTAPMRAAGRRDSVVLPVPGSPPMTDEDGVRQHAGSAQPGQELVADADDFLFTGRAGED